jgi:hypothetical protein
MTVAFLTFRIPLRAAKARFSRPGNAACSESYL